MKAAVITVEDLRPLEILQGLSDEQLAWLLARGTGVDAVPDDVLFKAGDPADAMFLVVQGTVRLIVDRDGQQFVFDTLEAGRVTGLLPYSRMTTFGGSGHAVGPTRVLRIGKDVFPDLLHVAPELGQRLVAIMSDRVREATRSSQQREKMMALGKLAAGLAHELNNPAAAVRRAAAELRRRLADMAPIVSDVVAQGLDAGQMAAVHAVLEQPQAEEDALSALMRSEREDELADWLDDHGVEQSWVLAETFVDAGLTVEGLEELAGALPESALPAVMRYLESTLAADRMLGEIAASATRISDLVGSVKSYSHMDQAPNRQAVDVHQGLESTLTMLGHKLKKKGITVTKRYQPDLPKVAIFVSEMNQVWTNLIDNAIDAMDEGGELVIETEKQGGSVFVRIQDNGSGIPAELQPRIFEPFFTTKDVGEGTGLGLDIVQRIARRHQGSVDVSSRPGRTVFTVNLPLPS